MTIYIGLNGYARSGKDTVASFLRERGFESVSFAGPLKQAVKSLDPIVDGVTDYYLSSFWDSSKTDVENWEVLKDRFPEVRRMLQRMGTEVGRNLFGENFWVQQAFSTIPQGIRGVVFTDARFPNEAQAVIDHDGVMVRINRPGTGAVNAHPSETSLDDWRFDYVIQNNGTLVDLENEVVRLLKWVEGRS